jgi:hypothetical protein
MVANQMSVLSSIFRWVFIGTAAVVALVLVYLCWLALKLHLSAILLFTCLFYGAVFAIFGLPTYRKAQKKRPDDATLTAYGQASAEAATSSWRRICVSLLNHLFVLTGGITMLWSSIKGGIRGAKVGDNSVVRLISQITLDKKLEEASIATFVLILICYGLAWSRPNELFWLEWLNMALLISVCARHLKFAIDTTSLPTVLRRQTGNAYVSFAIIAVLDICSIILGFNAVANWKGGELLVLSNLISIAKTVFLGLIELGKQFWAGETMPPIQIMMVVAGAIYGLDIFDTAKNAKEFKRTDEDYLAISWANILAGNYNASMSALKRVGQRSGTFYLQRAATALGVLQIGQAWNDARQGMLHLGGDLEAALAPEEVLTSVTSSCVFAFTSDDVRKGAISYAVGQGIFDPYLAESLLVLFQNEKAIAAEDFFPPELVDDVFPLCGISKLVLRKDFTSARDRMAHFHPRTTAEMAVYVRLILLILVADNLLTREERVMQAAKWHSSAFKYFSNLKLENESKSDIQLLWSTSLLALTVANKLESSYAESWKFISEKIRNETRFSNSETVGRAFELMNIKR